MLVLSRRVGEVVTIGDGIRVQVLEIRAGSVRLGFVAPQDTRVLRDNAKNQEGPEKP